MRHRMLWAWFGALLGTMLLWSAMPVVFSAFTTGVASPVLAADPILTKDKAETKTPATIPVDKAKPADVKTDKPAEVKTDKPAEVKTDKPADAKNDKPAVEKNTKASGEKRVKAAAEKSDTLGDEKVADESDGGKKTSGKPNFLVWLYKSLTLRYVVIFLILTFNAVALIVMIVLGLRRIAICPDDLLAAIDSKINERQFQEVYELARGDKSFLGKVLASGMAKLSDGQEAAEAAMQETGEELSMKLEQRNGYIALIAQIGPMFGLLGTVDGMVQAFDVIANSNVTPKPSELAQGIGTALVTTVVGLWIAIPMIAFYHIVRNRLTQLMFEIGMITTDLLKRLVAMQATIKKD